MRNTIQKATLFAAATAVAILALAQCASSTATHTTTSANTKPGARVARMWRGEVPVPRADEYEAYLRAEGLGKLRAIPGNLGVQTFRRTVGDREEFVVISYWPDEATIRAYAGQDVTRARLMPRDPEFLINPEPHVRHYRILE